MTSIMTSSLTFFIFERVMKYVTTLILTTILFNTGSFAQFRYKDIIFSEADKTSDIIYGQATDYTSSTVDLKLDFYEPKSDTVSKRALIIYIHGGGFNSGDKDEVHISTLCDNMATRGYAVASINYRLDPNFDIYNSNGDRRAMIDAMHDAKAAIRFFRKEAKTYRIDPNFIVVGGESAGAATSMLASYVDEQSELSTYPMANPNNIEGNSGNPGFSSETNYTLCLCGLMLDTSAIKGSDQPLLWIHSTNDTFVPYSLAKQIPDRADNIGLTYESYTFVGATHCPWYTGLPNSQAYLDTTLQLITDFIYRKYQSASTKILNIDPSYLVFPNPTSDVVNIAFKSEIVSPRLYNSLGKDVTSSIELHPTGKFKTHFSMKDLPVGIYYFDSGKHRVKVVKM